MHFSISQKYTIAEKIASVNYTRKNAQVVTSLQTSCPKSVHNGCQQVGFALLVPSCCNKFGTSC
jgi:hypothetical protein